MKCLIKYSVTVNIAPYLQAYQMCIRDRYVTGSHNVFSYRTNIDISNRLVCFDIKELGSQLKKIAMLIIPVSYTHLDVYKRQYPY